MCANLAPSTPPALPFAEIVSVTPSPQSIENVAVTPVVFVVVFFKYTVEPKFAFVIAEPPLDAA